MTASEPMVVFDAGGVLVRICRTWDEGARRAGIEAPGDVMAPGARARRRELSHLYQSGRLHEEDYFARMAEAIGNGCAADIIARVHDAWLIEEYPGARALVDDLAAAGVGTALLSNTNARHWRAMCPQGGAGGGGEGLCPAIARLGRWFLSHELGACKPEEAIYAAVEREAGALPEAIIFFDDLEENVAAARGRGWQGLLVDHSGDPPGEMRRRLGELGVL